MTRRGTKTLEKKVRAKQKRRSPKAKGIDRATRAKNTYVVYTKKSMTEWLKHPNRTDIIGLDTPRASKRRVIKKKKPAP